MRLLGLPGDYYSTLHETTFSASDPASSALSERSDESKSLQGDDDDDDDESCPVCAKYGRGPCGPDFWAWRKCCREHDDNDDEYLTECASQFERFLDCLKQHEAHESEQDGDHDDD